MRNPGAEARARDRGSLRRSSVLRSLPGSLRLPPVCRQRSSDLPPVFLFFIHRNFFLTDTFPAIRITHAYTHTPAGNFRHRSRRPGFGGPLISFRARNYAGLPPLQNFSFGRGGKLRQSGPELSPDWHFPDPIGAQFGPRFKTSPNKPYFGNRTILKDRIGALSCPIPGQNG